jgi:hypothetical protein
VALRLEECNTFVRGNFNPYVVTPEWLASQEIWQPNEAEVALALAPGLRFRADDVEWVVDAGRLLISSTTADCGKLAAAVLKLLPHTPVLAVGNNFTFVGDLQEWETSPVPMLGAIGPDDFPEDLRPSQVRWSSVIQREEVSIEIGVVFASDGVAVRLNFHRPTPTAAAAAAAAGEFHNDKKAAGILLERVAKQEVQK